MHRSSRRPIGGTSFLVLFVLISSVARCSLAQISQSSDAPTRLTAEARSESSVGLSWRDNSKNERGFEVERAAVALEIRGGWSRVAELPKDTVAFTDLPLDPGATYDYRVRAYGKNWRSSYSEAVRVTLPSPAPGPGPALAPDPIPGEFHNADDAPPLPVPSGSVVRVTTVSELEQAVAGVTSGTTILIEPGQYALTRTLVFDGGLLDVSIRGSSGNPDDVVLLGPGMTVADHWQVPHGILAGGATGLVIAHLTIRDFFHHCVSLHGELGCQRPRIYDCRLVDSGEAFVKAYPAGSGLGIDGGAVEYTIFEYRTSAPGDLTNGLDVESGRGWTVKNCLFRNLRSPAGGPLAGPAVAFWNESASSVCEGNAFFDCERGIAYGLTDRQPYEQTGGIIRNNFFYRSATRAGEAAIHLAASPGTRVLHNTLVVNGTYPRAIEYRYPRSSGVDIRSNLSDAAIQSLDGSVATVESNSTGATADGFQAAGDPHLAANSPALDIVAAVDPDAEIDYDGQARPSGLLVDAGADERVEMTLATAGSTGPESTTSTGETSAPSAGASSPAETAPAAGGYDIVYVRYLRQGDLESVDLPDGESPYPIEDGADLMLLHPDGAEEILVASGSVLDPVISFDGKWVYYVKYVGLVPDRKFYQQPGHAFLYKMRLDVQAAQRVEIQLTDLGDGYAIEKNSGNEATDESSLTSRFGIRDLAPCPLPDGRILFCSNREAVVAFHPEVHGNLSAVEAATVSQLFVVDDHDGSTPNRNLRLVGPSILHHAQHPTMLADGRVLFTNWDDAALREHYGIATLYTCHPDGSNLAQFLEPHNTHKKVDHFATELGSGHVVVVNYYPFMAMWGFGLLHRYPRDPGDPPFLSGSQSAERDYRYFSRKGVRNMTTHTHADDVSAPNNSGRYTTPSAAPGLGLLVAYSPGPVVRIGNNGSQNTPRPDSGIYRIDQADLSIVDDPAKLVLLKNDPAYNEIYPRPVVSYAAIHGVEAPSIRPPTSEYSPTPADRGLVRTSPVALGGTSSMQNRQSATFHKDWFNAQHAKLGPSLAFVVQGTDVGKVLPADLYGVRVVAVTPDRYHTPFTTSSTESGAGLLWDSRVMRHVKGYYSHTDENWKVLGEFPVRSSDALRGGGPGLPDPDGQEDTSFLAKIPAETPFFYQGIDRRGMTLFTEETWRHAIPGETQASCGGCHAHSIDGVPFQGKKADSIGYRPWNLVGGTPLVIGAASGPPSLTALGERLLGVEFRRDVLPLLRANCAGCHTSSGDQAPISIQGAASRLSLFDSLLAPGYASEVRSYQALAKDKTGKYAYGTTIPAGQSRFWSPQMSRYVRAIQARRSLLAWKICGSRLDGWTNADFPLSGSTASEDIDYEPGTCPAPALLTDAQKSRIARWIDLGCPIDLDRPKERYTDDGLPPVVTAELVASGDRVELRVGLLDLETGLDPASLRIEIRSPLGTNFLLGMSDLSYDADSSVGTALLGLSPASISPGAPIELDVFVKDLAGNSERLRRTIPSLGAG